MKEGDTVICVDASRPMKTSPILVLHRKYIVYGISTMPCGCQMVDVGLVSIYGMPMRCMIHSKSNTSADGIHWCYASRFRVIEPEYRTVEISSEIKKQELQLN